MMRIHIGVALVSSMIATTALAQDGTLLPTSLSGRWTYVGPPGTFIDAFSIIFEGNGAPGTVPGRLTWHGRNCGASDEPIQASWDGMELKFEAVLKANTPIRSAWTGTAPRSPPVGYSSARQPIVCLKARDASGTSLSR